MNRHPSFIHPQCNEIINRYWVLDGESLEGFLSFSILLVSTESNRVQDANLICFSKQLHMSANCTSKQTNKMNMNMLNFVETKTILIMILLFCKCSSCNFVLLDSLGNCVEGCMCPLKGLVHCTMPCSPPPPLPL